jgi:hypothetical protein
LSTCDDKGAFTDDESHTGNTSKFEVTFGGQEVGNRQGTEEVVVIWSDSVV